MDLLASAVVITVASAPFAFAGLLFVRTRRLGYAAMFLALLCLDITLTGLPLAAGLNPPGLDWNWVGKTLSLSWALVFVFLGPIRPVEAGLTLKQRPGTAAVAVGVTIFVIAFSAFMIGGVQQADAETLLFQATMPGLAEELVFRGVLFALLLKAFSTNREASRSALVYATLVTAIAFGLWHGLGVQEGQIVFNFMAFLFPFLGGLIFGWLRAFTGSLLFPVLAHNGANLILYLLP